MSVSYGGSSITFEDGSIVSSGSAGFKNKIINGAMMIDQRNAGASVTANNNTVFSADRWFGEDGTDGTFTLQQTTTAPAGFKYSIKATVGTADASLTTTQLAIFGQRIEGYNVSDLDWGTANAKTITISWWTRSSATGSFGGAVWNSAGDRSYPFSYTINSADTWEYKTVTIAGDTSGTWLTTNGRGINLAFALGAGPSYSSTANIWTAQQSVSSTGATNLMATSDANLYIAGVQLEKSTTASSFEFRSYGKELMLCQRYYEKSYDIDTVPGTSVSDNKGVVMFRGSGVNSRDYVPIYFKQTKRDAPTVTIFSSTGASGFYRDVETPTNLAAQVNGSGTSLTVMQSNSTATTNKQCSFLWTASSEL